MCHHPHFTLACGPASCGAVLRGVHSEELSSSKRITPAEGALNTPPINPPRFASLGSPITCAAAETSLMSCARVLMCHHPHFTICAIPGFRVVSIVLWRDIGRMTELGGSVYQVTVCVISRMAG